MVLSITEVTITASFTDDRLSLDEFMPILSVVEKQTQNFSPAEIVEVILNRK